MSMGGGNALDFLLNKYLGSFLLLEICSTDLTENLYETLPLKEVLLVLYTRLL